MEAWSRVEIASFSHLAWVPAREPSGQARFDREVEVESFLCLLHAVAASTEEEKQKLEDSVWKKISPDGHSGFSEGADSSLSSHQGQKVLGPPVQKGIELIMHACNSFWLTYYFCSNFWAPMKEH